jgi:hypothetical protein
MRFKKLRTAVGISMIIFVLVVANLIAFGLIQEKLIALQTKDILSESRLIVVETQEVNQQNSSQTNTQPVAASVQPSAPVMQPTPAQTVVQTTRKSRAS